MGENYCVIAPSRGDRPDLLKRLVHWMCDKVDYYIIDDRPLNNEVDIVLRIKRGFDWAKSHGYEFIFILEDDDYYPDNYFSLFGDLSGVDFVGYSDTVYYNIKHRTYEKLNHPNRSSLFCTGFRISALDRFNWPNDNEKFLDIKLWEYCMRYSKNYRLLIDNPCLGIKGHGVGKAAGKGHVMPLKNQDKDLSFLKSRMNEEAFTFYNDLMEKTVTA